MKRLLLVLAVSIAAAGFGTRARAKLPMVRLLYCRRSGSKLRLCQPRAMHGDSERHRGVLHAEQYLPAVAGIQAPLEIRDAGHRRHGFGSISLASLPWNGTRCGCS